MSLRTTIENNEVVAEFGDHDDSVPDYKYYVVLKHEFWHPTHWGRDHSATSLQGILDFIKCAVAYEGQDE